MAYPGASHCASLVLSLLNIRGDYGQIGLTFPSDLYRHLGVRLDFNLVSARDLGQMSL